MIKFYLVLVAIAIFMLGLMPSVYPHTAGFGPEIPGQTSSRIDV
ncbi:MAG: hypothetical protein WAK17_27145 [Candidatus Nitrosopolaris sp.]